MHLDEFYFWNNLFVNFSILFSKFRNFSKFYSIQFIFQGPTIKRRRLENYPIAGKGGNVGAGETAAEEEQQQSTTSMNNNNPSIQFGGEKDPHNQQMASNSATAAVDLSSANSNISLGPFDQLLKNASRCNLKMNGSLKINC